MQTSALIRTSVIINASAGAGYSAEWANDIRDKFNDGGLDATVTLARSGTEIIEAARRAVTQQLHIVVAGGGDGTINAVAAELAGTDIALGVLPLGTLNHFAKDLKIPQLLDDAVRNIINGHRARIDVGEVNGRIFLNNSSLGMYPDIVRDREKQQRRLGRGKWPAFMRATMMALRRYPFLYVKLNVDNKPHHRSTPFVFIGNNQYEMEGFNIGARRRLDAGQLSLYVAQRTGRWGLFRLAVNALFVRLRQAKDFDMLTAREIVIETRMKRLRVATDGEVTIMDTPLRYCIRTGALLVITPENTGTAHK
jgi:diacylglycerol kinase family enzyme